MIKITVRGARALDAINKDITILSRDITKELPAELIDDGYNFALKIAPHDSGATKNALITVPHPKTGVVTKLRLVQPIQNRAHPRPYHLWMHGKGNRQYTRDDGSTGDITFSRFIARIVRRGKDPNFMETTKDYMERELPKLLKKKGKLK